MFEPSVNLRRSGRLALSKEVCKVKERRPNVQRASRDGSVAFEAILLDIEGTTTPISFVHEVLFPFADKALDEFLDTNFFTPETQQDIVTLTKQAEEDKQPITSNVSKAETIQAIATYIRWQMANDKKTTALKRLQGRIWTSGYNDGRLVGDVFADVAPCLEEWKQAGMRLYIYSSGSIEAQQLLFGHSKVGDLRLLLSGYFDTTAGNKKESASYVGIAKSIGIPADKILFLTDIYAEAEAADLAGLKVAILSRPGNNPALAKGARGFPMAKTFHEISSSIIWPQEEATGATKKQKKATS